MVVLHSLIEAVIDSLLYRMLCSMGMCEEEEDEEEGMGEEEIGEREEEEEEEEGFVVVGGGEPDVHDMSDYGSLSSSLLSLSFSL